MASLKLGLGGGGREKYCPSSSLFPVKIPLKNIGQIFRLTKLRELVFNRSALKEILKRVLKAERKWYQVETQICVKK